MVMKKLLKSLLSLALALTVAGPAAAAYPEKPVNMIIAFTAGGSSDVQARIMQKYWNKYAPQPWVFIYKPGAGGIIGFTEIALAKKDGYTIGGLNVPHIILQSLAQNAQFDPIESFEYIAQVHNDPQVIAVRKDSPYNTVEELFAAVKENPNKFKVGLSGQLSGHHVMFLTFKEMFPDLVFTPVFYKGSADQNAALLGGEIDLMFGNINDITRSLDELKILGVAAEKRNIFVPDVPTLKELGIDYVSDIRRCFAAPKGVDPEALKTLRAIFKQICEDPDYINDMHKAGQPHEYMSGEDFAEYIKTQYEKNRAVLQRAGIIK